MTAPDLPIPGETPVMPLPGSLLFPQAILPLYIFEPRYRSMLRWALERERMFCVALLRPGFKETAGSDHFFHTACVGIIRACVMNEDGTSRVMLQGMERVRFTSFSQLHPFPIARIEKIQRTPSKAAGNTRILRILCNHLQLCGFHLPEKISEYLARIKDPGILADTVAHTFLRDALKCQQLLEEDDPTIRVDLLTRYLREEIADHGVS